MAGDNAQAAEAAPREPAQPLAVVNFENGYAGLVAAFRAAAAARGVAIGGDSVAAVTGLCSAYVAKLLQPRPTKRVGLISLGPLLGALSIKLLVVEDPEALEKYGSRIPLRKELAVHGGTMEFRISRRAFRQLQAKGRRARWDKMTPAQRTRWARKLNQFAGNANWPTAPRAMNNRLPKSPGDNSSN